MELFQEELGKLFRVKDVQHAVDCTQDVLHMRCILRILFNRQKSKVCATTAGFLQTVLRSALFSQLVPSLLSVMATEPESADIKQRMFRKVTIWAEYCLLYDWMLDSTVLLPFDAEPAAKADKADDCWIGLMSPRDGRFAHKTLRFLLLFPDQYPEAGPPQLFFDPIIEHPLVDPKSGEMHLEDEFGLWTSERNCALQVVAHARRVVSLVERSGPVAVGAGNRELMEWEKSLIPNELLLHDEEGEEDEGCAEIREKMDQAAKQLLRRCGNESSDKGRPKLPSFLNFAEPMAEETRQASDKLWQDFFGEPSNC